METPDLSVGFVGFTSFHTHNNVTMKTRPVTLKLLCSVNSVIEMIATTRRTSQPSVSLPENPDGRLCFVLHALPFRHRLFHSFKIQVLPTRDLPAIHCCGKKVCLTKQEVATDPEEESSLSLRINCKHIKILLKFWHQSSDAKVTKCCNV